MGSFLVAILAIVALNGEGPGAKAQETATGESAREEGAAPSEGAGRVTPSVQDGNSYRVTEFELSYESPLPDQIPIEVIRRRVVVQLLRTEEGFVAPRPDHPGEAIRLDDVPNLAVRWFYGSAISKIIEKIVEEFNREQQVVVLVQVDENDIDQEGHSIRPEDRTALALKVVTGKVTEIRTLAFGERIPSEDRMNNPAHARIQRRSPIGPGDPVWKDRLDNYIYRLNRHPGRRVDVALSAAKEPNGVTLDYLVYENKPWLVYGQVSNTGTEATNEWQERFGFLHNQLSGNDDIFSLQYITGGFEETHAVVGSYEVPLFLEWLRAQISGTWSEFDASNVGQFNESFDGNQWTGGGQLIANVFQYRQLFVDLFAGVRYQEIEVFADSTQILGREDFLIPGGGVRLERLTETASTLVSVGVDVDVAKQGAEDLESLGRLDPEDDFVVLNWNMMQSLALDPIYYGDAWKDVESDSATLAHELVVSFEGQHAFDSRLAPQFERTVGGLYTVRGYPESNTAGDTVFITRLEYLYHLPRGFRRSEPQDSFLGFGQPFRFVPQQPYGRADWNLTVRGFADFGRTINADRRSFESNDTLTSVGLGLEFRFKSYFGARVDWGVALNDVNVAGNPVDSGDSEFHFVFTLLY